MLSTRLRHVPSIKPIIARRREDARSFRSKEGDGMLISHSDGFFADGSDFVIRHPAYARNPASTPFIYENDFCMPGIGSSPSISYSSEITP